MRKIYLLILALSFLLSHTIAFAQEATTTPPVDPNKALADYIASTTQNLYNNFEFNTGELPPGVSLPSVYQKIPLTIELTPEFPGPNEEVTAKVISYSTNLPANRITWYVNDVVKLQKGGATSFTFNTGNTGTTVRLTVSVLADNGYVTTLNKTVVPTTVDMMWQAKTYTPKFYRGKALNSHQSSVVVVANPTIVRSGGVRVAPENLVYRWEFKDKFIESGLGKNSIVLDEKLPGQESLVRVDISTTDGSITTRGLLYLTSVDPKLVLYEEEPDGIRYDKVVSMKKRSLVNDTKIAAIPYFLSTQKRADSSVTYTWSLNNQKTTSTQPSVYLTTRNKEGEATVNLEAVVGGKLFQKARTTTTYSLSNYKNTNESIF